MVGASRRQVTGTVVAAAVAVVLALAAREAARVAIASALRAEWTFGLALRPAPENGKGPLTGSFHLGGGGGAKASMGRAGPPT